MIGKGKLIAIALVLGAGFWGYLLDDGKIKQKSKENSSQKVEQANFAQKGSGNVRSFAINCIGTVNGNLSFKLFVADGKGYLDERGSDLVQIKSINSGDYNVKFDVYSKVIGQPYHYEINRNTLDAERRLTIIVDDKDRNKDRKYVDHFKCAVIEGVNPVDMVKQMGSAYDAAESANQEKAEKDKQKQLESRKI